MKKMKKKGIGALLGMILTFIAMLALSQASYGLIISDVEGNNDILHAQVIPSDYLNQQISGTVPGLDKDYFKFTPQKSGVYCIDLGIGLDCLKVSLQDNNGVDIYNASLTTDPLNKRYKYITYGKLTQGIPYFIRIERFANGTQVCDYSFTISEMPASLEDNNNSMGTASNLPISYLSKPVYSEVSAANDTDFYRFVPQNSGGYVFEFYNNSQIGTATAYLYDESGKILDEFQNIIVDQNSGEYGCQVIGELTANKVYYLEFKNTDTGSGAYRFMFNLKAPKYIESEPNSTFEIANILSSDLSIITTASIDGDNDIDYYRFTPLYGGIHTFESTGTGTMLELYDKDYHLLTNSNIGNENYFKIGLSLNRNENYYLKVHKNPNKPVGDYGIKIARVASTGTDNNDNSFATAGTIGANGVNSITSGINSVNDVDYYKFTAPETGIYSFETKGLTNTSGEAYTSDNTLLCSNDDGGKGLNFNLALSCTAGKTYFIKVKSSNGGVGEYTISVMKGKVLKLPQYCQQPYNMLCGKSTAAMIISYLKNDNIDRTVELAKGGTTDLKPFQFNLQSLLYEVGNYVYGAASYTNFQTVNAGTQSSYFTFESIKNSIDNSFPVGVRIYWDIGSGGHFIVIKGYYIENGVQYIVYNDPWDGREVHMKFSYFKSSENDLFNVSDAVYFSNLCENEANNTFQTANSMPLKSGAIKFINAFLTTVNDVDYYCFTPAVDMSCAFTVESSMVTGAVLYDNHFTRLMSHDNFANGTLYLRANLNANTTYYLKVYGSGSTGEYILNANSLN